MRADLKTVQQAYHMCSYHGGPPVPGYLWRSVLTLLAGQVSIASFATSRPHEDDPSVKWTVLVALAGGLVIVEATGEQQSYDPEAAEPAVSELNAGLYPYSSVQALKVANTVAFKNSSGMEDESWSAIWQLRLSGEGTVNWPNPDDHNIREQRDSAETFAQHLNARLTQ